MRYNQILEQLVTQVHPVFELPVDFCHKYVYLS